MRLITANIRFDSAKDGPFQWKYRKQFLAETLKSFSPHLIATQEGRRPQLQELEVLLGNIQLTHQEREWIKERMYPCFFRSPDIEIKNQGDFWLSQTPTVKGSLSFGSQFPRLMTYMVIKIGNIDCLCINTHLDHLKSETRLQQARVLCEQISKLWPPEGPLILMGDYNEGIDGEVRKIILKHFPLLYDPFPLFYRNETHTVHHFEKKRPDHQERIDWILVSSHFNVTEFKIIRLTKENLFLSDHDPVYCEVEFSG